MKKYISKKDLKVFGLGFLLAILSVIPRKYVPESMFSNEQLVLITFVIAMVMVLQNNIQYKLTFIEIIIKDSITVFIFTLILSVVLSWTFLQLLPLFLFVYILFKMFQVLKDI